jgi:hypothetical protein
MIISIGISNGNESNARKAIAMAARGCVNIFQNLQNEWRSAIGTSESTLLQTTSSILTDKPKRKVLIKRKDTVAE